MTTYCPNCGDPHVCANEVAGADGQTQITLARIEADRDVRIAELGAQASAVAAEAAVEIAADEAEVTAARARGEADGMETAIAELSGADVLVDQADEPGLEAELEAVDGAELEPAGAAAPMPPVDAAPPRAPKRAGWWDNYA